MADLHHSDTNHSDFNQIDLKDFSSLVDSYYAKVFHHCVKLTKNNHDSADITQNTFIKAFIKIKNLKNADSFGAWIFAICNNEIKMFYRNSQKNISDSSNIENIPYKPSSGSQAKYNSLYSAIDGLDEKYKNLVILKYFAEFSVKEIAVLAGIDEKLIKSRLYDARKKLEKLLTQPKNSAGSLNNYNKERKKEIMSTVKLLELGLDVVPSMSLWGQKELLKCAENNAKFSSEVLSEMAKIEKGGEFTAECGGRLSYHEFIKILAGCSNPEKLGDKVMRDVGNYLGTGGYIAGVSLVLYVPSIKDTVKWYKKYLNWDSDFYNEPEDYGHAMIRICSNEELPFMVRSQFHLRSAKEGETPKNVSMFISLDGMSITKVHEKIKSTGLEKISDIYKTNFGAMSFRVEDLNGVGLEFLEWRNEDS